MSKLPTYEAFVRAAELGTFSAAALEMRVQQSTVSKWIAGLECDLGAPLFDRTTRSLRLTAAGETMLKGVRQMLAAYESAVAEVQTGSSELRGRVRVSAPTVFGTSFLTPIVAEFLEENPAIELELHYDDRYVNLLEERFDLAIRVGRPVDSSLRAIPLGGSKRHLLASPDYLAAAPVLRTPADLSRHSCLSHVGLENPPVWKFTRDGKTTNVKAAGRAAANNSAVVAGLARQGAGIALLAEWLVRDDIAAGALVPLLASYELARAPVQALVPPSRAVHPRVRAFVEHLSSYRELWSS